MTFVVVAVKVDQQLYFLNQQAPAADHVLLKKSALLLRHRLHLWHLVLVAPAAAAAAAFVVAAVAEFAAPASPAALAAAARGVAELALEQAVAQKLFASVVQALVETPVEHYAFEIHHQRFLSNLSPLS